MTRFEWDGLVALHLPDGWELGDAPDVIEIVPPDDGAAHISILRRTEPGPVQPDEPASLVEKFVERLPGAGAQAPPVASDGDAAYSQLEIPGSEGSVSWWVWARVWPEQAVVCSYNADEGTHAEGALALFRTNEPL